MCPCCGEEEEDLEHVLKTSSELESLKRKNFMQVPLLLSVIMLDQAVAARYFWEVFNLDLP
jgi:hypothetical protein